FAAIAIMAHNERLEYPITFPWLSGLRKTVRGQAAVSYVALLGQRRIHAPGHLRSLLAGAIRLGVCLPPKFHFLLARCLSGADTMDERPQPKRTRRNIAAQIDRVE